MSECQNFTIRDQLPEYVHGALDEQSRERVESHLELCVECAAELGLLRAVVTASGVPTVDVTRIVAAIPAYGMPYGMTHGVRDIQSAPSVTKKSASKAWSGAWYRSGVLQSAAAFLIVAVGIGGVVMNRSHQTVSAPHGSVIHPHAGVSLVNVSDLSDDNLETLIQAMDNLDASPPVEPDSTLTTTPVLEGGSA